MYHRTRTWLRLDGKRLEYTAWLYELNTFLAQLEFLPDPNYNGPDELVVMITDGEYASGLMNCLTLHLFRGCLPLRILVLHTKTAALDLSWPLD